MRTIVLLDSLLFRHVPEILFELSRSFNNGLLLRTSKVVVGGFCIRAVSALRRRLRVAEFVEFFLRGVVFGRLDRTVVNSTAFREYSHGLSILFRSFKLDRGQFIIRNFRFQSVVVPV